MGSGPPPPPRYTALMGDMACLLTTDFQIGRSVPGVEVDMHGMALTQPTGGGAGGQQHQGGGRGKGEGRRRGGNKKADHRMYAAYNQFN